MTWRVKGFCSQLLGQEIAKTGHRTESVLTESGLYHVVPELLLSSPVSQKIPTYFFIPLINSNRMTPRVVNWMILAMT